MLNNIFFIQLFFLIFFSNVSTPDKGTIVDLTRSSTDYAESPFVQTNDSIPLNSCLISTGENYLDGQVQYVNEVGHLVPWSSEENQQRLTWSAEDER